MCRGVADSQRASLGASIELKDYNKDDYKEAPCNAGKKALVEIDQARHAAGTNRRSLHQELLIDLPY